MRALKPWGKRSYYLVTPLELEWAKISGLETNIFELKMMVIFFNFLILLVPSELPANLQGQFSLSWQVFFALGSSNSEGACRISK